MGTRASGRINTLNSAIKKRGFKQNLDQIMPKSAYFWKKALKSQRRRRSASKPKFGLWRDPSFVTFACCYSLRRARF